MTATPSTTDEPSTPGGWLGQWTDLLFWPWRELPAVMRAARQLISTGERSAPPSDEVAARLDAVQSQLAGRLEQTELLCRELDAVRAATAALQRRVDALEAQSREEDDAPDVPRLPMRASDAFSQALARAGAVAAQRGLTTGAGSATLVRDHGPEMHAEADPPGRPSRKAPRNPRKRS
jgi:hypothetical protein